MADTAGRVEAVARDAVRVRVIGPRRSRLRDRAREVWQYRGLVGYFGRRYVEKTYIRTWLGWVWLPLRPVLDVGSRVLLFGGLLGVASGRTPYLLFFLVGMGIWQLFASTTYWATRSLELNRRILKRLYVPRVTAVAGAVAPSGLDYLLYLAITALVVGYYALTDGTTYLDVGIETLYVGGAILLVLALALSIGLWTCVYGAQARDVRFALNYVLGFWFFLTPVIYPLSTVPEGYRTLASLNPMTAPVELVKLGVFGEGPVPTVALASTFAAIAVVGATGMWFFERSESAAVDNL